LTRVLRAQRNTNKEMKRNLRTPNIRDMWNEKDDCRDGEWNYENKEAKSRKKKHRNMLVLIK